LFAHEDLFVTASLTCVSGPLARSTIALDAELSFGRDPANGVCIPEVSLSRRHCVITEREGAYFVRDLESHNGTLVNGVRITERQLEHGDHIKIGASVFQFNLGTADVPQTATVSFDDLPFATEDVVSSPERLLASQLSNDRLVHDFGTLLMIATRLRGIRNSESLLWQLVGVLFEVVPADRVAILLGEDVSSLQPAFAWDKESGPGIPVRVSRTVVNRVITERQPLLVNDVPQNLSATSLRELEIYSVLCVPMCTPDKQLGLIYVDTRQIGSLFDAGHLHLMSAIATIAALGFENARSLESLEQENQQLKAEVRSQFDIIGDSAPMKELFRFIAKVAPTESNVIVYGESGTGKELVARAVHRNSRRADKTFVAINCAALTESLLESELFGYEKGAFTGALTQKRGYLEAADGGTIFLDEIGELALNLQAKLLRVLQEREVVRVGGTRPIKVDLRVLAATNKPLAQLVKSGKFREDLFYRLDVVSCHIPPLRNRREDIPSLARHFAEKYAVKCNRHVSGVSHDAISCLTCYDWPGNVRELENAVERAVVLGSTSQILRDDLPESLTELAANPTDAPAQYHAEVARKKRELILNALIQTNNNFTDAAKLLGIHPNYLHRLVRILDLRAEVKRA
jgi:transcriptional regulator with GAF, ATPase, and Fis domain